MWSYPLSHLFSFSPSIFNVCLKSHQVDSAIISSVSLHRRCLIVYAKFDCYFNIIHILFIHKIQNILYADHVYIFWVCMCGIHVDSCLHMYRYICVWKSEVDIKSFLHCPPHTLYLLKQGVCGTGHFSQRGWPACSGLPAQLCVAVYPSPPPV